MTEIPRSTHPCLDDNDRAFLELIRRASESERRGFIVLMREAWRAGLRGKSDDLARLERAILRGGKKW